MSEQWWQKVKWPARWPGVWTALGIGEIVEVEGGLGLLRIRLIQDGAPKLFFIAGRYRRCRALTRTARDLMEYALEVPENLLCTLADACPLSSLTPDHPSVE